MRKIKIITDSTSDLNEEHYKMLDAEILSLGVNFGEIHYVDRVDITTEEIYKKVKETNKLPKTNAVNVGEMLVSFEKYLKMKILYLFQFLAKCLAITIMLCLPKKN